MGVRLGVIRVGLGIAILGGLAYFLSQSGLKGFTTGAAVLAGGFGGALGDPDSRSASGWHAA